MIKKIIKVNNFFPILQIILILSWLVICDRVYAGEVKPVLIKEDQKCAVCGMRVSKFTNWYTQIVYSDGSNDAFCSVKCLMAFYLEPLKYSEKKKSESFKAFYAKDYYSQSWYDMKNMFFVLESDVLGPMGRDLIPFADIEHAKTFLDDHNGSKILRFNEITLDLIKNLRKKKIND